MLLSAVCSILEKNVIAVIGPRTSSGSKHTHQLCSGLHVPQITPDATDSRLSFTLGDFDYLIKVGKSCRLTIFRDNFAFCERKTSSCRAYPCSLLESNQICRRYPKLRTWKSGISHITQLLFLVV